MSLGLLQDKNIENKSLISEKIGSCTRLDVITKKQGSLGTDTKGTNRPFPKAHHSLLSQAPLPDTITLASCAAAATMCWYSPCSLVL